MLPNNPKILTCAPSHNIATLYRINIDTFYSSLISDTTTVQQANRQILNRLCLWSTACFGDHSRRNCQSQQQVGVGGGGSFRWLWPGGDETLIGIVVTFYTNMCIPWYQISINCCFSLTPTKVGVPAALETSVHMLEVMSQPNFNQLVLA